MKIFQKDSTFTCVLLLQRLKPSLDTVETWTFVMVAGELLSGLLLITIDIEPSNRCCAPTVTPVLLPTVRRHVHHVQKETKKCCMIDR